MYNSLKNSWKNLRRRRPSKTENTSRDVRRQTRFVTKKGVCNVAKGNYDNTTKRIFGDTFTTLVDLEWFYSLSVFSCVYLFCWTVFAIFWYILSWGHGDVHCMYFWGFHKSCLHCPQKESVTEALVKMGTIGEPCRIENGPGLPPLPGRERKRLERQKFTSKEIIYETALPINLVNQEQPENYNYNENSNYLSSIPMIGHELVANTMADGSPKLINVNFLGSNYEKAAKVEDFVNFPEKNMFRSAAPKYYNSKSNSNNNKNKNNFENKQTIQDFNNEGDETTTLDQIFWKQTGQKDPKIKTKNRSKRSKISSFYHKKYKRLLHQLHKSNSKIKATNKNSRVSENNDNSKKVRNIRSAAKGGHTEIMHDEVIGPYSLTEIMKQNNQTLQEAMRNKKKRLIDESCVQSRHEARVEHSGGLGCDKIEKKE